MDGRKNYVAFGSIFISAFYYRYILQLCKKATGMILSLLLALQIVFFFFFFLVAAKQVNIKMLLASHRFLYSKESKKFCRKKEILMSQYPVIPGHLLRLILLLFEKQIDTYPRREGGSFWWRIVAFLGRFKLILYYLCRIWMLVVDPVENWTGWIKLFIIIIIINIVVKIIIKSLVQPGEMF